MDITEPAQAGQRAEKVMAEIAEAIAVLPGNLADWFEGLAAAHGNAVAGIWLDEPWSYRDLDRLANRVGHAGLASGLGAGDTVAIMLRNSIQSYAAMIGLAKIGVGCSLLDPDLAGAPLRHALQVVPSKLVLRHAGLGDRSDGSPSAIVIAEAADATGSEVAFAAWVAGRSESAPPRRHRRDIPPEATLFHVFTSGTTGLPKATRLSHARYLSSAASEAAILGIGRLDRIYVVLPMFHIAALSAMGAALSVGGSFLLRERFSARAFWDDVRAFRVTALQYLGEIARYVAARPRAENDRDHPLRAMIGAGMQPDVWHIFRERFGITGIYECYGSSEGVCNMINFEGLVGSVGRPMPGSNRQRIVRLADDGESVLRQADGRFADCADGEVGELIGEISQGHRFEGYSSAEATAASLLTEPGEGTTWFRTGDLFRRDKKGNYYFVDRRGESFRWKGENVSTQEVADAIRSDPAVRQTCVFGVRVPGAEGRAGMALVEPFEPGSFDPNALYTLLAAGLKPAAIPVFLRVGSCGALTSTYKVRTRELKREGYGPDCADPLFVLDRATGNYRPLDDQALAEAGYAPFGGAGG